ncbi:unnamed protein product, partial [marine sediment metagenome]
IIGSKGQGYTYGLTKKEGIERDTERVYIDDFFERR